MNPSDHLSRSQQNLQGKHSSPNSFGFSLGLVALIMIPVLLIVQGFLQTHQGSPKTPIRTQHKQPQHIKNYLAEADEFLPLTFGQSTTTGHFNSESQQFSSQPMTSSLDTLTVQQGDELKNKRSDPDSNVVVTALEQQNDSTKTSNQPTFKVDVIWLENFFGMKNVPITAELIEIKKDKLKFILNGNTFDYSGHYTIVLCKPRTHKRPFFSFDTPDSARYVHLDNWAGQPMILPNATIWEKADGFIDVTTMGDEWIYSGTYQIQQ